MFLIRFVVNVICYKIMKNSKVCPKCNSSNVIKIPCKASKMGKWNNAVIWIGLKHFDVTRYMCSECGFIEEWIDIKDDIDVIAKKYK